MGEPAASGYAYVLPGAWLHLDLAPDRLPSSVRRAVALRVRREPGLAAHQGALDQFLRQCCVAAATSGAERVSLLAERIGGQVMSAAVVFSVYEGPAGWAPDPAPDSTRYDDTTAGPDGRPVRQWQHVWAWPGRPRVGLLTLSSVCPPLWADLERTFAACVTSFRWTFPSGAVEPPH